MGYCEAMEMAGATVHNYREFGSYQGDWYAYVTYEGVTGWVRGSYGSCSGCDAFEAEFGYGDRGSCSDHRWNAAFGCSACEDAAKDYNSRLADFGRGYLDGILSSQDALAQASEHLEWDMDAREMVDFIREVSGVEDVDEEEKEVNDSLKRLGLLH